jgi:heme/copper-type cytochrome/quinol oxidase subunit 2
MSSDSLYTGNWNTIWYFFHGNIFVVVLFLVIFLGLSFRRTNENVKMSTNIPDENKVIHTPKSQ